MNSPPLAGRTARIDDIQHLYEIVRMAPGLPMPRIGTGPDRASLDYRYITHAGQARVIVADTRAKLGRVFGVTFTEREVTDGDGICRYLLETLLEPSGLALVIISRVALDQDADKRAGKLVAA